jgi:hypothetical protein
METKKRNTSNCEPLNHPDQTRWMEYLYDEIPRNERMLLDQHLKSCPDCARNVHGWRSTMAALDTFTASGAQSNVAGGKIRWRWAIAAAAVVIFSFLLGRVWSNDQQELAKLRGTVEQLNHRLVTERQETIAIVEQFFSDFSKVQVELLQQDQRAVNQALTVFDRKVAQVESELETVAINTANNFEQTHDNLKRVASISLANNETYKNTHN